MRANYPRNARRVQMKTDERPCFPWLKTTGHESCFFIATTVLRQMFAGAVAVKIREPGNDWSAKRR